MFNKLGIIGVGLIGGSVARAARQHELSKTILGFGREQDLSNLKLAKDLGVVDDYSLSMADITGADCIVIATPVGAIESVLAALKPYWDGNALYTDTGSAKANVLAAAQKVFGHIPHNLIPAHPIAGAEQSGVLASINDLFCKKQLIITPDTASCGQMLHKAQAFWEQMGAHVTLMDAAHHDAILAATSHLPHILAFALVDMLGHKDEQSEIFKYAASGFRDFTRIASSDPTMWLDICAANKGQIVPLIQQFKAELDKIQHLLETENSEDLFDTFTYAGKARQRFLDIFEN